MIALASRISWFVLADGILLISVLIHVLIRGLVQVFYVKYLVQYSFNEKELLKIPFLFVEVNSGLNLSLRKWMNICVAP